MPAPWTMLEVDPVVHVRLHAAAVELHITANMLRARAAKKRLTSSDRESYLVRAEQCELSAALLHDIADGEALALVPRG